MDLRDYARVLRKRWLSILVISVLGVGVAGLVTYLSPKQYTAETQSFVAISNTGQSSADILSGATFAQQRVKSYTQIVDSPEVLQPVIIALGLSTTPQALAKNVTASSPLDTVLINVDVKDGNAQQAADIANAVAKQLGTVVEALETPDGAAASPVKVTLTNPAIPPPGPSSPRPVLNLALGLLIGLALGLAYAFVRESLDTTIKSIEDVTQIMGQAPLGAVPYDAHAKDQPLVALDQKAVRSEAFRSARTNLAFADVDKPPQVVVITSAVAGEGKTTSACNLAITMAQSGQRVVLVECDLRRPRVANYLEISGAVGLTNVLTGQVSLDEALVMWNRGQLAVLTSGLLPPNPSELLGSRQMSAMLDELRTRFDAVVIDAPPLLPVTDGAVIAHAADGAVMVVRHGKTTREQLERATEVLDQAGVHLLGAVVNFVPVSRKPYTGDYYSYSTYGYAPTEGRRSASHSGK
jgi:capsular exopolysaccharide synthesis family protein